MADVLNEYDGRIVPGNCYYKIWSSWSRCDCKSNSNRIRETELDVRYISDNSCLVIKEEFKKGGCAEECKNIYVSYLIVQITYCKISIYQLGFGPGEP